MVVAPWPTTVKGVVIGGVCVGLLAGLVMAVFTMAYAAVVGLGFWAIPKLMAAIVLNDGGSSAQVVVGLILHFGVSAIFGVIFAAFMRYSTSFVASLSGIVYALLIWVTTTYVVLPLFDPLMSRAVRQMFVGWALGHLLFGLTLGAAPVLVSRFSKPESWESEPPEQQRIAA